MPGAIFLGILVLAPPAGLTPTELSVSAIDSDVLRGGVFVALSYALGVVFNLLAGIIRPFDDKFLDRRDDSPVTGTAQKLSRLADAFKDVFGLDINEQSWRLCYGIAEKSGFGVRIDLFSSLNMFCRSMFVGMALLGALFGAGLIRACNTQDAVIGSLCLTASALFAYGAAVFSKVFSAAIYEAFLTWYVVERVDIKPMSTAPTATGTKKPKA